LGFPALTDGAVDDIMEFAQAVGLPPTQIDFALRHGIDKKLLQAAPLHATDSTPRYRITTVGAPPTTPPR
jgi:hypothetical protein